jgi:hypothetical protein
MARWKKRPLANHRLRADDCRRHPHMWIEIGTYNSTQSATSTARQIRLAERLPYYTPAGAYETRVTLTDFGAVVCARYIGDTA